MESRHLVSRFCTMVLMGVSCVLVTANARAAIYYVSIHGADANDGSFNLPFATLQHANAIVEPGDTVYIRGGTYRIKESGIAQKKGIFARVILLDKSGEPGKRINYFAYKDEHPIFDFSEVKPASYRVYAISVPASWIHLKGLGVVGVQVTIKEHTQSICFENNGDHNIYEQLRMHDGQAIGYYSVRGSDNLVLNCDAYNNWDYTSENGKGGNADGFGCHPGKGSTGNIIRGCRSWFNSDDGFDLINAAEPVTIENCWSFNNGYSSSFKRLADGNGFKGGGYGSTPVSRLPDPIPRHTIQNCLSVHNKANGFYANHHIGGDNFIDDTAYRNGANFNMLCRLPDNKTEVPGYGHVLRNDVSVESRNSIININREKCQLSDNRFDVSEETAKHDYESLDESQLVLPRRPNGNLPRITFLKPVAGSALAHHGYEQDRLDMK